MGCFMFISKALLLGFSDKQLMICKHQNALGGSLFSREEYVSDE